MGSELAAVVLAGGAARRLGGAPKPLLRVGGQSMLDAVLAAVAGARFRVVVGPASLSSALPAGVALTREDPPGGGPVAATAAGLALVPAGLDLVAVIAADLPFLTASAVDRLSAAITSGGVDVAHFVDGERRAQWVCVVWRAEPLRRRLAELGRLTDAAMGLLAAGLAVSEVEWGDPTRPPPWFDCDTEDDVRRAEEWAHGDA